MYLGRQLEASKPLIRFSGADRSFRIRFDELPVRRLGVGTKAGQAVGGAIVSSAAFAGPAAPIVAAVGGLVELISSFFGGGCGSACTQSATLEQVPEVALDDLHAVAQLGMIGAADFQAAWQEILNQGISQLQTLEGQGDTRAAGGITNLEKSTDYTSFVASLPAVAAVPVNLSQAQAVFTNPGASGWEPGSVSAGNALALQVLQQIAVNQATEGTTATPATAVTAASSIPVVGPVVVGAEQTVNTLAASSGIPSWLIWAGAAALAWGAFR